MRFMQTQKTKYTEQNSCMHLIDLFICRAKNL